MLCPRCGKASIRKLVHIIADVPGNQRSLDKAAIRNRDVVIQGVDWDKALYYCTTKGCGYVKKSTK